MLATKSKSKPNRPPLPIWGAWLRHPLTKQIKAPLLCTSGVLILWQILCKVTSSDFPGPIEVVAQTWNPYIINPFYDDGGTAKGLGWQIIISLQRALVRTRYTIQAEAHSDSPFSLGRV